MGICCAHNSKLSNIYDSINYIDQEEIFIRYKLDSLNKSIKEKNHMR